MPPRTKPSTSRARSPSPTFDNASEDIFPLAYDSEEELLAVLARLRGELRERTRGKWEKEGRGKGVELGALERVVLENFFDKIGPIVLSNCTIAGLLYADYVKQDKVGETEPFSEELHAKVLRYQDDFFVARVANVNQRKALPLAVAGALQDLLNQDQARLATIEGTPLVLAPREKTAVSSKRRKSTNGRNMEGPSLQEAESNFIQGKETVDRLLKEIPMLSSQAVSAQAVAMDVGIVL